MLKCKGTDSGYPWDYGTTLWNSLSQELLSATAFNCILNGWETALYDGIIFYYCCFISF